MKLAHPLLAQAGACAALGIAALLAPLAASAATRAEQTALRAQYQSELAACRGGQTGQELSACLREAHAAYAQAQRGGLGSSSAPYAANARQRCDALSGSDKSDCVDRMAGHGTVSGSVKSGGMLRELTTYSVGARPVSPGTPASAPPPPRPRPVPVDPTK
ncbi:MAG: hypothetical protein Q8K45_14150 [Rubrivivax sp.]|nr:hypothetical protein [Rubrivivax sp.]